MSFFVNFGATLFDSLSEMGHLDNGLTYGNFLFAQEPQIMEAPGRLQAAMTLENRNG
jgi:hypothetical protein